MTLQKNITIFTFILITLFNTYATNLVAAEKQDILLDKIVAIVNDDIILKSDLDNSLLDAKIELQVRNILIDDDKELELKVLDNLIIEKLQLQRVQQQGIEISDDELLVSITEIAKNNKLTVLQIRNRLNANEKNGFEAFREKIRLQLLFQKLRQIEVLSLTQVSDNEINNYLQRQNLINNNLKYNLGHIVVSLPESSTPKQRNTAQAKAENILKKINNNEDFSQLAVRHSQGSKALQGGDLGWLSLEQIPTFFSEALNGMQVGEHSQIIKSPIGFHIIKLLGKKDLNTNIVTQYHLYRFTILSDEVKQNTNATAPKNIIKLSKSINSLQDFQDLWKTYPEIPAEINTNSDLGWVNPKQISQKYSQALLNIQPKHATLPISSEQGWDIIYLDATRKKDLNLINKRQQAINTIKMKKANETFEIWLRRLKDEALIDIRI